MDRRHPEPKTRASKTPRYMPAVNIGRSTAQRNGQYGSNPPSAALWTETAARGGQMTSSWKASCRARAATGTCDSSMRQVIRISLVVMDTMLQLASASARNIRAA